MEQEGLERYVSRCKFLKIVDCDFEVSELGVISLGKRNGVMDGSFCYSLYAVVVMFSLLNYSYGWSHTPTPACLCCPASRLLCSLKEQKLIRKCYRFVFLVHCFVGGLKGP